MNERTHFFIKIYLSHFILERVDVSVVCERWVERHILRERTSSSHILFQEPGGANACTPLQARQRRLLFGCVSFARLPFSALCLNLTAWFSSRDLLPVTHLLYPSALIALLFTNHNVTACQSTRGHQERTKNPCHMLYNTTTLAQNGPGSNRNEGVLYIPQSFRAGASSLHYLISPRHSLWMRDLYTDAIGIFYSPS